MAGLGALLTADTELAERSVLSLNAAGTLPPLIYLHGDFAGGMYATTLAALLGQQQPVIVVPPHGVRGRPRATTVEAMAADVLSMLETFVPDGPMRFAGYSAAGLVAYEAARLMRAAGRDVLDVVLIGTSAENVAFAPLQAALRRLPPALAREIVFVAIELRFRTERFLRVPPATRVRRVRDALVRLRDRVANRRTTRNDAAFRRYLRAHDRYIPPPYGGRLLILWPSDQRVEHGNLFADWHCVAPAVVLENVPGSHHAAVSRHLPEIVRAMQRRFGTEERPSNST